MDNNIKYEINGLLSVDEFIDVLKSSGLAARRPIEDFECMNGMIDNANLIVLARDGDKIIGVVRSVTDFTYCCYLSDLAVDKKYQHSGIGKMLIRKTKENLGKRCKIILLSAPTAVKYYPKIGFKKHNRAYVLDEDEQVR